ncbi:pentapeptide repeat-containing protein [Nostoc sp. C052]|uniref:pentapeptide repeat-containing protein n=1 Tax=Nostoc sp. C052 TaxID=2576902 RepID=UPI0015C3BF07|nr:pentapeptide repeat-containing protein [Nostoc sp. C052]QLE42251.1 pentapeptide repeat-containing protein [Nostoc sp. C052]
MTLQNRRNINFDDAKAGLSSLVKQTALVGVGFLLMLLLTGGNPSALVVGFSVCLGIIFVAWSEKDRLTISHRESESQNPLSRNNLVDDAEPRSKHQPILIGGDLISANLSGKDLNGRDLKGRDLNGRDLSFANLSFANLSFANLIRANLSSANLIRANLSSANLSSANLIRANLSSAILRGANLGGANLSDANLSGAKLNGANLDDSIVMNALFGSSKGLTEDMKRDLEKRGAIFGDRPPVLSQR